MNLSRMLEESALRFAEKTALVQGDRRLSYAALNATASRVAAWLYSSGVRRGDRVAMLMGNSIEFVAAYFGITRLGAVAVLLDPKYKPLELASLLDDCRPRALLGDSDCLSPLAGLPALADISLVVDVEATSRSWFSPAEAESTDEIGPLPISDSDLAHIAYTSGPSFNPAGIMVTHGNLLKEINISATGFAQSEADTVIQFALPMHHVIGLVVVLLASIYCGCRLVILGGVSIDSLTASIERHKVTMFVGVPFIHAMLVRKVEEEGIKHDLGSLRLCGSAGDILPFKIVKKYRELLNFRLVNFYGLTETLGHVTCEPLDSPLKDGSAGTALPGWRIKIIDYKGRELMQGQAGEIIISGPMMAGYYNRPELNRELLKDGWLQTGDRGVVDKDGDVHILGLQKDMLICKGQNIFPSDIEHVLSLHPAVLSVAAVGVPDEMRGEVVGAAVVFRQDMHASEAALLKFCLERMANYKAPKYFAFMDALPLMADGKADKSVLRAYFRQQPKGHNAD